MLWIQVDVGTGRSSVSRHVLWSPLHARDSTMARLPRQDTQSPQEPLPRTYGVCRSLMVSTPLCFFVFLVSHQLREPKEAEQELQDIIKDYQEYKAQKLGTKLRLKVKLYLQCNCASYQTLTCNCVKGVTLPFKFLTEHSLLFLFSHSLLHLSPLKSAWWQVVVKLFTTRSVRLALVVGCGLQMFQQFGGINTVM